VKALLSARNLVPICCPLRENTGVSAGQLEGASMASQPELENRRDPMPVIRVDALGQTCHLVVEIVVRGIDQRAALLGDGFFNYLAAVTERVDADATEYIEIAIAVFVNQMDVFARYNRTGNGRTYESATALQRLESL